MYISKYKNINFSQIFRLFALYNTSLNGFQIDMYIYVYIICMMYINMIYIYRYVDIYLYIYK